MNVQCRELDKTLAERVASWTFPAYRHLLDLAPTVRIDGPDRRPIRPVGVVAMRAGQPQGLMLGCVPEETGNPGVRNDPELLSIYVAPAARRQGVGSLLVRELERAVGGAGFPRAVTVYMTGKAEIEFLERILTRQKWSAPEARMLVLKGPIEQLQSAPWYGKYASGERFEYFPWSEMSPADLGHIEESQQRMPWIPEDLVPWRHGSLDASSIGIKYGGEVVGWVLNHNMSGETIRFTCSFIRRDLARRARIVPAYSESIGRAAKAGFRRCMFTVPARHREMAGFAMRWCAPWMSFQGETRESSKELSAPGGPQ